MRNAILILLAATTVAACANHSRNSAGATGTVGTHAAGGTLVRYTCEDRTTVDAHYPTVDTARLRHSGRTIELTRAISASGARYVGDGWEWWTKGMTEGRLTRLRPGEDIASADGVACTTP